MPWKKFAYLGGLRPIEFTKTNASSYKLNHLLTIKHDLCRHAKDFFEPQFRTRKDTQFP